MPVDFSKYRNKLSPASKRLLMIDNPADQAVLNILFQTEKTPSAQELAEINEIGCHVHTVAGDVLTGQVTAENIPRLAALDYVKSVDLSQPLFLEDEERKQKDQNDWRSK